jgi:hypothetical protein
LNAARCPQEVTMMGRLRAPLSPGTAAQRRALIRRMIQGFGYAGALGFFLAAGNALLWPADGVCLPDQVCAPMYAWLLLGMAVCGALAGSAKDLVPAG